MMKHFYCSSDAIFYQTNCKNNILLHFSSKITLFVQNYILHFHQFPICTHFRNLPWPQLSTLLLCLGIFGMLWYYILIILLLPKVAKWAKLIIIKQLKTFFWDKSEKQYFPSNDNKCCKKKRMLNYLWALNC